MYCILLYLNFYVNGRLVSRS